MPSKPTPIDPIEPMHHPSLNAALVAALGDMPRITKGNTARVDTRSGPGYSYKYADLADVLDAVRPVLARHGLAVVQDVRTPRPDTVEVRTIVIHADDEREFGPVIMTANGGPQALGSSITYARRYALLASLGIATEDDDDDAQSAQPPRNAPQRQAARRPEQEQDHGDENGPATSRQLSALGILAGRLGMSETAKRERVIELIGRPVNSSRDLTRREASLVIATWQADVDTMPSAHEGPAEEEAPAAEEVPS